MAMLLIYRIQQMVLRTIKFLCDDKLISQKDLQKFTHLNQPADKLDEMREAIRLIPLYRSSTLVMLLDSRFA
ncbi:hypothetical protein PtA15_8A121 [Puccinia triticina]|uniref:Uncharacterized protein n=1 Tax=Puccinia triticina TaxID=208348 RepID=A0ABY7CQB0_9BASI|nr:uncharacterized protein PtA15_8A121 [Puccinia triticina]WAQ87220.1 hypothetical protein PtA15_8A121 [Puccinia triticina]